MGPAECQNDTLGIRLKVPAGWWYSSGRSPCQFLNRERFDLAGSEPLDRVAIEIRMLPGDVGTVDAVVKEEHMEIDGRPATVWELHVQGSEGGVLPPNTRLYEYIIQLGPVSEFGPNLLASTSTLSPGYEENRLILDEVMQSLRLLGG
jgi:hypothetical protein